MSAFFSALLIAHAPLSWAQLADPDPDDPLYGIPTLPPLPSPEGDAQPEGNENSQPDGGLSDDEIVISAPELPPDAQALVDYSRLPPGAERAARLDALFARLGALDDTTETPRAQLVSEEIWALWMDSGSASVNYLLVRADAAQRAGNTAVARDLLNRMMALQPDWAEVYARSARLALSEEDYARAVEDATEALVREPRHFYALWTLGNVLERVGKREAALEVYEEAHALFPLLGGVKERLDTLRGSVLGDVL